MSTEIAPPHSRPRSPIRPRLLTGAAILLLSAGCRDLDAAFDAYCDLGHCRVDAGSDGGVIDPPHEPRLELELPDSLQKGDCGTVRVRALDAEGSPLPPAPGSTYAFTLSIAHELPELGPPPEVHVGESCQGPTAETASWQGESGAGPWVASIRSHRSGRIFVQAKAAAGTALATHSAELLVPRRVHSIDVSFSKSPVPVGSCVNALLIFKDEHGEPVVPGAGVSAKLLRSEYSHPNLFAASDCAGEGMTSIQVSSQGPEPTPFSYRPMEGASKVHQFEALVAGDSAWLFPSGGLQVEEGALEVKPPVVNARVGDCTLVTAVLVDPDTRDSVPHAMGAFKLSGAPSAVQLFARDDSSCASPLPIDEPVAVEGGLDLGFRLKAAAVHESHSWQLTLEDSARGSFTTTFSPSAAPDRFIFGPFTGTEPGTYSAADCNSIPVSLFSDVQGVPVAAQVPVHAVISSNDPLLRFGAFSCELAEPELSLEFDPGQTTRDVFFIKPGGETGTSTLYVDSDGGVALPQASKDVTLE